MIMIQLSLHTVFAVVVHVVHQLIVVHAKRVHVLLTMFRFETEQNHAWFRKASLLSQLSFLASLKPQGKVGVSIIIDVLELSANGVLYTY